MKPKQLKEVVRQGEFSRHKTTYRFKVRFVLIKKYSYIDDEKEYDWVFATNLHLKSQKWYLRKYKKRWGIETLFRVTDELRIRTATLNQILRYFLHLFTCLIYNIWKFAKWELNDKNDEVTFAVFVRNLTTMILKKIPESRKKPGWPELDQFIESFNII